MLITDAKTHCIKHVQCTYIIITDTDTFCDRIYYVPFTHKTFLDKLNQNIEVNKISYTLFVDIKSNYIDKSVLY